MRRRLFETYRHVKYVTLKRSRLNVRPTDCFVASWPRSGNTWLRYLLFHALYPETNWDLPALNSSMPSVAHPRLGRLLPDLEHQSFRMFKSHETYARYFLAGRVAYLVRDGRDAISSFFHYRTKLNQRRYTFHEYLDRSLSGKFHYGSWHEHVRGWLEQVDHPSLLIVRYEDLLGDPAQQLKRVLHHFGTTLSDDRIHCAVERSSVENVNQGFQRYAAEKHREFSGGRGGGSGRYQDVFDDQAEQLFNAHAGEVMQRLGYASCETTSAFPTVPP